MSGSSPHIALVDDDASVRKALARLLAGSSFEIKTYGSARDFLSSLEADTPECLILDLNMPETTGFDLQRDMQRAGIDIPTIFITGCNIPGLRERCYATGATAFMSKPLDAQRLIKEIYMAVNQRSAFQGDSTLSTLRHV